MSSQITVQEALAMINDPTTPGPALQNIAVHYPNLWPQIATHPQAYPELLDWLNRQQPADDEATEPLPVPTTPGTTTADKPTRVPKWPNFPVPTPQRGGISKPMLALIIGLAVALVAAIGVFGYLLATSSA